jgi:L-aminopeptidase/D-esterase-like protein
VSAAVPFPAGFAVGHSTDLSGLTGCTVVVCPEGAVAACDVRGGATGTRETALLAPSASQPGVDAILLAGGSAFGLAAADGVAAELERTGRGFATPAARVPLVAAAVLYDLALGDPSARPDARAGAAAVREARPGPPARGSIGAGAGCTVGKALGPSGWMRGGLGLAGLRTASGVIVAAIVAVNAYGEILAEDGSVLAGPRRAGRLARTADVLAAGEASGTGWGTSTTLACVVTDAALDKRQAWIVARAASAGIARAVVPAATPLDSDVVFCAAAGSGRADLVAVCALAAEAVAAAVRDAVRSAGAAPGCPAAADTHGAPA